MKTRIIVIWIIVFAWTSNESLSGSVLDSLLGELKHSKNDTTRIRNLNLLSWELLSKSRYDTSLICAGEALKLGESLMPGTSLPGEIHILKKGRAVSYNIIGLAYYYKGDLVPALDYLSKAQKLNEEIGEKKNLAGNLGNIGLVYLGRGDYPKALQFLLSGLKINEELKDKRQLAKNLSNIGLVYAEKGEFENAMAYYSRALGMNKEIGDKGGIAKNLSNIGIVHKQSGNLDKALIYYNEALKIGEELGDKNRIAIQWGNMGSVYAQKALLAIQKVKIDSFNRVAADYFFRALRLKENIKDHKGVAIYLGNIGNLNVTTGKYAIAEEYLLKALALSDSLGLKALQHDNLTSLTELYRKTGRSQKAFDTYKTAFALEEELNNAEKTKKQTQLEMQYQFDTKQLADSVERANQKIQVQMQHEQKLEQQRTYMYGGVVAFLLMLTVAVIAFRAYRQKGTANEIILKQKLLVDQKQREIIDSIHYAKRIQRSLLPTEKYIQKCLGNKNT